MTLDRHKKYPLDILHILLIWRTLLFSWSCLFLAVSAVFKPSVTGIRVTWEWLLAFSYFGRAMSLRCNSFYYGDDCHLFIQVLSDCDYEYFIKNIRLFYFAHMASLYEFSLYTNLDFLIITDTNINLKLIYLF